MIFIGLVFSIHDPTEVVVQKRRKQVKNVKDEQLRRGTERNESSSSKETF
jgi:hypothetical protein